MPEQPLCDLSASRTLVYRGVDRRGTARTGVSVRTPSDLAREMWDRGFKKLRIEKDGREVGGICPGGAGVRSWWGEDDDDA